RAVASIYRRHETSATADLAAGELGGRRVVERYFERHPELRRSGLAERAEARLEARAGRARLVRGRMLSSARRLGRATRLDPGALAQEVEQSLPVVAGFLRRPAARHYAPTARRSSSRSR